MNLYGFVSNRSVNLTDPFGLVGFSQRPPLTIVPVLPPRSWEDWPGQPTPSPTTWFSFRATPAIATFVLGRAPDSAGAAFQQLELMAQLTLRKARLLDEEINRAMKIIDEGSRKLNNDCRCPNNIKKDIQAALDDLISTTKLLTTYQNRLLELTKLFQTSALLLSKQAGLDWVNNQLVATNPDYKWDPKAWQAILQEAKKIGNPLQPPGVGTWDEVLHRAEAQRKTLRVDIREFLGQLTQCTPI